ncbi:junctional adhesion molecule 2A-like [Macrosteles quadrilineatus]|uniref:junctional adhesion molecule 2A-like n=1 Tax=Macrosteles quadrilineatus TaxID=74068 RepID=UPI0023E2BD7B|nr:junctional adhesion molecule 2A-like [Macrosteles quadrilineatus]
MRFLLLFVFGSFATSSVALSQVRVKVPDAVLYGEPAVLHCFYDLETDSLYSVKWYKGQQEFYRFTPRENPPVKIFPIHGMPQLQVQEVKSNATQVTLRKVLPVMSGHYSCEVSADAPSFQTALVTGKMKVVTPPRHSPSLHGLRPRYRVGERLRVNCTSAESLPAANLSWLINGHQVDERHARVYHTVSGGLGDLETVTSILEKSLVSQDFNSNSRLKIRCTASILSVYWKTTEKSAELERPKDPRKEHQPQHSQPSVLLNLKTDVGTIADVMEHEPTRVTVFQSSSGCILTPFVLWQLLNSISWTIRMFQYSFTLT